MRRTVAEAGPAIKHGLAGAAALPELALVCACLAPGGRLAIPDGPLDAAMLVAVARRHQVSGLVARRLALAGRSVPPRLAQRAQSAGQRAMRQMALALDLAEQLEAAGIDAVFLKGLALSQQIHGSPVLRAAVDIDVLVAPGQIAAAWQVLQAAGFVRTVPAADPGGQRLALYCRASKDSIHHHRETGMALELHWRMAEGMARPELPQAPAGRRKVELAPGRALPVLDDGTQFIHLAIHGAAHGWARLKWLVDVALLLDQAADGGAALWRDARGEGAGIAAASAIVLAGELLALPPPPGFAAPRSLRLKWLLWMARRTIAAGRGARELDGTAWRGWTEMLAKMLVAQGWRARLTVAGRLLLSGEDIAAVPLPPVLFWLYPVLRVPLLVRRRLLRAAVARRRGRG